MLEVSDYPLEAVIELDVLKLIQAGLQAVKKTMLISKLLNTYFLSFALMNKCKQLLVILVFSLLVQMTFQFNSGRIKSKQKEKKYALRVILNIDSER